MQGWKKGLGLVLGLGIVAGGCTDVEHISAPEAARFSEQVPLMPPADSAAHAPQDDAPGDSAGSRWGGYMGNGG